MDQEIYNPYGGNQEPLSLGFLSSALPMLGGGSPPRYTGPANFNTGMGNNGMSMMLQQMMPFILSKLSHNGRVPAQFFPEQGFYEQMKAQEFFMANQQAMQMATQSDTSSINRTLGGLTQMMTGKPLTEAERTRNFNIASTTSQMMPMLTQMLGPDLVDSLHGSRGSAAIFASQLHSALRTSRDPVTGAIGMSGESAGNISRGVYENLFGEDYNPATLRGMSAGQAGMLAKELQTRGLLGVPLGGLGVEERRAALPDDISDATFRRIAGDTKAIRELGGDATQEQLDAATAGVRNTYAKLKDRTTGPLTAADIDNEDAMPGGADLMRTADASRIAGRLKNMSGAVKAMREIFGDMGNPNAPMREIVDGLNKLTQGGLSSMSAEKLEMTVRKTQAIAKQTGMSVEGIMALTAQATQMGDPLGLHRKQAVFNAQQSAMFAAAGADSLYLDSRISGQVSPEHLAAADLQLRTHATASPAANQMRAALRMLDKGMVSPAEGSKLAKYIEAIKTRSTDYEFRMEEADYVDMLATSGANRGAVETLLRDRLGNQSYGDEYDINGTVRRTSMRRDAVQNLYGPAVQNALNLSTIAGGQDLLDSGVLRSRDELQIMTRDVGQGFMQDFLATDAKVFNNVTKRTEYFKESLRNRVISHLTQKMPGATPAAIAAAADNFIAKSGGGGTLVEAIYAEIGTTAGTDVNAKTAPGTFAMYGDTAFKAMEPRNRQAVADAIMGSAFAGLGTTGPMARVMDILQSTGAEGITGDKVLQALGSVSAADIQSIDPTGPLATSLGLWAKGRKFDPSTAEGLKQLEFNADAIKALTGGDSDFAKAFRLKYATNKLLTDDASLMKYSIEAAAGNFNVYEEELKKNPIFGSNIAQAELDSVSNLGELATKRLDEKNPADGSPAKLTEKSIKNVDDYIKYSTEQAQRLRADKNAMLHLGTGSEAEVQSVVTYNQQLQAMAAEKNMTVAELLRTGDAEARKLFDRSVEMSAGISKKYGTAKNTPMTEGEKSELDAYTEFEAKYVTAEEKQAAAKASLFEVTPLLQRGQLETGYAEAMLSELLADPSRSSGVAKAARAKREILQMALKQNLFGGKKTIDELTAEEMATADDKLDLRNMPAEQQAHLDRLKADAKILDSLDSGDKPIDLESLQRAVEAIPMTQANAAGGNNSMNVVMTGTFEELETGRKIKIVGEGDAVARALMSSSVA